MVQPEVSPPPAAWSSLVRPGVFTVLFTGASLGGCAVWQYENMRRGTNIGKYQNVSLKIEPTQVTPSVI